MPDLAQGAPRVSEEPPWALRRRFGVPFGALQRAWRASFRSSEHDFRCPSVLRRARQPWIEKSCTPRVFFLGVGGSGRRPSRMCNFENSVVKLGSCLNQPVSLVVKWFCRCTGPLRHASNLCGPFLCNRATCCVPEAPLKGPLHMFLVLGSCTVRLWSLQGGALFGDVRPSNTRHW